MKYLDEKLVARLVQETQALAPQLAEWRRRLHQNPEVGFGTADTEAFVREKLSEAGIELLDARLGVLGVIRAPHANGMVGLRADMDALPMEELNDVPYCSKRKGAMHACGHDGHTAMLLGAAMVLQALAAYRGEAAVAAAVSRGVDTLSAMQNDDGGFTSWGSANAESVAQVIVACTALGIDPDTDSRFVKDGGSAVDALLTFYDAGAAAFRHKASGGVDSLATEQAVYALVAVSRFQRGQSGLYQETDAPTVETPAEPDEPVARVLCTADGSGLIPAGYRTVAVCLPDAAADSTVTFSDGTQLLYSPVLSERSDTPTWVWLFAPDVTDDALNDTANYTVTEGKGPVLTAGDVNADGVINAQDALNIRTACAASTVPETQLLLTMDVDLNGRVDAQDVRALADSFVQNTALPTAQEDGQ